MNALVIRRKDLYMINMVKKVFQEKGQLEEDQQVVVNTIVIQDIHLTTHSQEQRIFLRISLEAKIHSLNSLMIMMISFKEVLVGWIE